MIGAFVFGDLAGTHASSFAAGDPVRTSLPGDQLASAHELIYRPLRFPDGPPQPQVEYKLRRFVNDYVAPPKTETKLRIAVEAFQRMAGEIEQMGARTSHELMRCAEVSFIRDCAELATRASLVRTESRWGLYHDRRDHPGRDDGNWFCHLNVRRSSSGRPEFVKRPVAPYVVPVPGLRPPPAAPGSSTEVVVIQPAALGEGAHQDLAAGRAPGGQAGAASPRILELIRLAEAHPSVAELQPYLADPDPQVRRAAVVALTETVPDGAGPVLVAATEDSRGTVRHAAVAGLRELAGVLPASNELGCALVAASGSPDAVVRAGALDVLRQLRLGDPATFAAAVGDADRRVRLEAVRALVSLAETGSVTAAADDTSREVRVAVAEGLAILGGSQAAVALGQLATDPDPLVRAAALTAAGAAGCPAPLGARAAEAVHDAAWQVREGAARALAVAGPQALSLLTVLAADPHADVRKAAVIGLAAQAGRPAGQQSLRTALGDADADVRAYARQALAACPEPEPARPAAQSPSAGADQ